MGKGVMGGIVMWRKWVFWLLAASGLVAYLSAFFVGPISFPVGSGLLVLAFAYLVIGSLGKWFRKGGSAV
jgi:hypothetical protein